jgi:hypothetical protein
LRFDTAASGTQRGERTEDLADVPACGFARDAQEAIRRVQTSPEAFGAEGLGDGLSSFRCVLLPTLIEPPPNASPAQVELRCSVDLQAKPMEFLPFVLASLVRVFDLHLPRLQASSVTFEVFSLGHGFSETGREGLCHWQALASAAIFEREARPPRPRER